jgi:hypothetical protein
MIPEVLISAILSAVVGATGGVFVSNVNLKDRLAAVELKMAEKYVHKEDLNALIQRMEDHLVRIENKFDQFLKQQR